MKKDMKFMLAEMSRLKKMEVEVIRAKLELDIKNVDEQEMIQKERARNLSLLLGDGLLIMQRRRASNQVVVILLFRAGVSKVGGGEV